METPARSMLSSNSANERRGVSAGTDVALAAGSHAPHAAGCSAATSAHAACSAQLYGLVDHFLNVTGLAMLETDGPYGGAPCAATHHAHHHGLEDSIYRQTQLQSQFYHEMRRRNVYVNQPDNFFFQGGSRTGMGYSENQYSLPRWASRCSYTYAPQTYAYAPQACACVCV